MATDTQLDTLEAKGLIRLATLQPELEYLFRHALVQDAAYESLLKQERRELHRSVGETLEQLYPDRRGELASVLAMHFEQAGEGDRAVPYLLEAARFAYARNAITEAFALYGKAAGLLAPPAADDAPETRRLRVEAEFGRVKAGFSFLREVQQIKDLDRLIEQAESLGDLRLAAEVHIHSALLRQFSGERPSTSAAVQRSLDRVAEIGRTLDDPFLAALPKSVVGLFQVMTGELRVGVEALRGVAPLLEGMHAFIGSSFALVALAIGLARLGEFDEAAKAAQRASEIAESGDLIARLDALIGESTVRSMRGDLDEAIPLAMQCTNLAEETGATACVVASNFILGDAYMRQNKFESAQIAFERGSEVAETFSESHFRPTIAAYMRSNAASLGDFGPRAGSFDEALALARSTRDRWGEANVIWKSAETEAKRPDGDRQQALADFATAAQMFESMAARPNLARTLRSWGQALRGFGDSEQAADKLRQAVAVFDELGIKREADELRAQLA